MVRPRRISDFKPTFTKLAQTSHYQLMFGGLPLGLRQHLNVRGLDYRFITETSGLLCPLQSPRRSASCSEWRKSSESGWMRAPLVLLLLRAGGHGAGRGVPFWMADFDF